MIAASGTSNPGAAPGAVNPGAIAPGAIAPGAVNPDAVTPAELSAAWNADPWLALALVAVAAAYALGADRLRRRPGGNAVRGRHVAAFAAALASLAVALLSPLDALAHTLASAHMVQHLVLLLVVPPLLVASRPALALTAAAPPSWRSRLQRWRPAADHRAVTSTTPWLVGVWGLHLLVLAAWHLPRAYGAAVRVPGIHVLEHATLLGAGWLLWWTLLRAGGRSAPRYGAAVLAVASTAALSGGLGALLSFASEPWYPVYRETAPWWGLTALEDQQLAGAVLWVVGGAAHVVAGAALFAAWLHALERRRRRRDERAAALGRTADTVRGLVAWTLVASAVAVGAAACAPSYEHAVGGDEAAIARGRDAVAEYGCVACHAIPGARGPQGSVGPPLAGLASRQVIAGQLPNTPENLALWVRDPQAVDPGNAMPDVGVSEVDARDIAAFLATLR